MISYHYPQAAQVKNQVSNSTFLASQGIYLNPERLKSA